MPNLLTWIVDILVHKQLLRILSQSPDDPFGLDPDGDGVACEVSPPSREQLTAYILIAVVLIGAVPGLLLVSLRRRARSPEGKEVQLRLDELQSNLRSVAVSIKEIDDEVSARRSAVDQLQEDAWRAEELSRLSATQVDGIKSALDEVGTERDRRSFRLNIAIAVLTTIISIVSGILINMYVP